MSDWSLEIGTRRLLDLLGEAPRIHVSFRPQLARDRSDLRGRRMVIFPDVPERACAVLRERAPIEPNKSLLAGHSLRAGRVGFAELLHTVSIAQSERQVSASLNPGPCNLTPS